MLLVALPFLFGGAFSIGGFSSGWTQDAVGYFHTYETLAPWLCMPVWARLHWFARALAKLFFRSLC